MSNSCHVGHTMSAQNMLSYPDEDVTKVNHLRAGSGNCAPRRWRENGLIGISQCSTDSVEIESWPARSGPSKAGSASSARGSSSPTESPLESMPC